ncbi:MAG: PQQ-like beta-propeller repeat protein [Candidatus Fermentibacteraceae bacterium]|nr:PQQ-like beta-propeller repeat protein [Candidatus Fermentibacteraceae bacterium]
MSYLIIALLGITVTQPNILDQTDEEWTALGYRVIEEVSINPLDYGEPIGWGENCNGPTASIGCQAFFVPTDNGEKWRIVMLLKDKLVILQEDEELRDIPLACSPTGIIYSRNGRFALVLGRFIDSRRGMYAREADVVNIETGGVRTFEALKNTHWPSMFFVNDDGSIYRWSTTTENPLEYYDPDLNLAFSRETNVGWGSRFGHASGGSIIVFLEAGNILTVYDRAGTLLWEKELDVTLQISPFMVSADGSVLIMSARTGLKCFDGFTGDLLWEWTDCHTVAPVPSVSGHAWAVSMTTKGLLFGADASSRESLTDMHYPTENWRRGAPTAVAINGACVLSSSSEPPKYQNNHLRKIIYTNTGGEILWISAPCSSASSPLTFSRNNNTEVGLRGGVNSIQSDGERFAYSDYNRVLIMRVEGGGEE